MTPVTRHPAPIARLLADFQDWVTRHGPRVSESSAKRYSKYAGEFCKTHNPLTVNSADLRAWRMEMEQSAGKVLKPSTVNVKLAAMRAMFAFLKATDRRPDDPSDGSLPMATVPKRLPQPLTRDAINALFVGTPETPSALYGTPTTMLTLQDRAMAEVLYGSGLRREEVGNLTLDNIIDKDTLRVIGKGDKERRTIITGPEYVAIRSWVVYYLADHDAKVRRASILATLPESLDRDERNATADEAIFSDLKKRFAKAPLFYTQAGTPLLKHADPGKFVYRRMSPYLASIGEVNTNPHRLRHTFATDLLDGGAELVVVQQLLGHDSITTTMIYVEVRRSSIQRARLAHPRG